MLADTHTRLIRWHDVRRDAVRRSPGSEFSLPGFLFALLLPAGLVPWTDQAGDCEALI